MLRFLHAGDLHLGSPLAAFSPAVATERRERQFLALETLLADALSRGARLVLLAGDCFDSPRPGADTVSRFFGILGSLPVPVVVAPGNHDYYTKEGPWASERCPANVHVFRSETLGYFDFPDLGATVYGFGFEGESAEGPDIGRAGQLPEGRTSILLAHADLTSPLSSYAPLSQGQLEQSGYTYAALGHIHKPMPQRRFGATTVAYSGFFAGRGFDEQGAGQARLIEIDGDEVRESIIDSTADTFEARVLDCTGAENAEAVRLAVQELLRRESFSERTALRVTLEGDVGLSCHIQPSALLCLGEGLALFELIDHTAPLYDAAYLEKAPTLQGAYYRALLPQLRHEDAHIRAVAARALRMGLSALGGREV